MRVNAGIIIVIGFLFLVGTVGAVGIPDKVTIFSDKSYVVAGSGEQATITAVVSNTTTDPGPVDGAKVEFIVLDPIFGTFTPLTAKTDINGRATSLFKVNTKSGIAAIRVNVLGTTVFSTTTQKIDHNKAYLAKFSHPLAGEVNTTVRVNISFTDYYGNPIDQLINTNQTHTISLHVYGPSPNDCNFVGYGHEIPNQIVDPNGNVSVQVKLTSMAGPNSFTMDQFELIPPPSQRIITAVSSEVSSMNTFFNPPSPPGVPADGVSNFTIRYTLYDRYGNPAGQKELWVNTSFGESTKFETDNLGQIVIAYGKKIDAGIITINATSVTNPFVNSSDQVEFTSTKATTIVLSANPEVMVSRDQNALSNSSITAKITTIMGGAAPHENVTFSLGVAGYPGGPYNLTSGPSLSATTATTDEKGDATVKFIPGGFNTSPYALYYSTTATGQVVITASWTDSLGTTSTKDILVKWKNYPYLSAKTTLDPTNITVNETVDVTIRLDADGFALQHIPIDVILVMDNSGTMRYGPGSRLEEAKAAARTFLQQMDFSHGDRLAVIWYNNEINETDFTRDFDTANTSINNIDKAKIQGKHTRMREALKRAIKKMQTSGKTNSVRAIIHMTDGDWSMEGTPLAKGTGYNLSFDEVTELHKVWAGDATDPVVLTDKYKYYDDIGGVTGTYATIAGVPDGQPYDIGTTNWDRDKNQTEQKYTTKNAWYFTNAENTNQNMSVYAKNSNLKLYGLSFAQLPTGEVQDALTNMANNTGAFYQHAPDQAALEILYLKIAGELNDIAGVDTTMTVDLGNVNVTGVTVPGADVFDYVYHPTESTKITWQNKTNTSTTWIDQSADWVTNNRKLNFTIGTMKVGDSWQTTFRLKVKKSGSIDIFGPNSVLIFNNSGTIETLTLPHTFLTVRPNASTVFEQQQIDVIGFCAASNTATLPVSWFTTYTGGPADIFEEVSYIDETGAHVTFYHGSYHVTKSTSTTRATTFNLNSVPQGKHYDIEVRTYTANENAIDSSQACGGVVYNTAGKMFIKLD